MGSLLNSLVVLTLLFGFIAAATTAAARPTTISRYGGYEGGYESEDEFPQQYRVNRFFHRFPEFLFGRHRPQPENPQPEEPVQEKARPEEVQIEKPQREKAHEAAEKPPPEEVPLPENGVKRAAPVANGVGSWVVDSENAGVSAMHIQLMPNNKAVWFDSTSNGLSEIKLNPPACKARVGGRKNDPEQDCTAHAIEYDVETAQIRPLKVWFFLLIYYGFTLSR